MFAVSAVRNYFIYAIQIENGIMPAPHLYFPLFRQERTPPLTAGEGEAVGGGPLPTGPPGLLEKGGEPVREDIAEGFDHGGRASFR